MKVTLMPGIESISGSMKVNYRRMVSAAQKVSSIVVVLNTTLKHGFNLLFTWLLRVHF